MMTHTHSSGLNCVPKRNRSKSQLPTCAFTLFENRVFAEVFLR